VPKSVEWPLTNKTILPLPPPEAYFDLYLYFWRVVILLVSTLFR
jgi:hypothetical protein